MKRYVASGLVIAAMSGCAAGDLEVSAAESALVGGTETSEFNAIGYLSIESELDCTATLIGPRAIITAGHCFENVSNRLDPVAHALFVFADGRRTAEVLRIVVIGVDGDDDVALAELGRDVSPNAPDYTAPLGLAFEPPGGDLRIFGYGCELVTIDGPPDDINCLPGTSNAKRSVSFPSSVLGDLQLTSEETGGRLTLAPGDSGGPVIGGTYNAVWGIVSETVLTRRASGSVSATERFGAIGWNKSKILNAAATLGMTFD